jgi:hypothetical protein
MRPGLQDGTRAAVKTQHRDRRLGELERKGNQAIEIDRRRARFGCERNDRLIGGAVYIRAHNHDWPGNVPGLKLE